MADISIVLGALLTLAVAAWRAVASAKRKAVAQERLEWDRLDAQEADDIRRDVQKVMEDANAELNTLDDDSLDQRLREARNRTR